MPLSRSRRTAETMNYWPSYVDALTTLVLSIVFILTIFMLAQFFLSQEVTSKDQVLNRLNAQIAELTETLALERAQNREARDQLGTLQASLDSVTAERDRLKGSLDASTGAASSNGAKVSDLDAKLQSEKQISAEALSQVEVLNQQIAALRRQIAALEEALNASESRDNESQTKIADLGRRLNVALAQRVQELARYRSDFFGRLREILAGRSDVKVVGDRFVFSSEVLFASGSDDIGVEGKAELDKLAGAIGELEGEIPPEISWVLRVDGHTDNKPITGGRFRDNWDLSAARAIAVVKYLIAKGVRPEHLIAAGFGEFQPLDKTDSDEARAQNRRIELKLTER